MTIALDAGAGYSGTPLAQKLGLKDGQRVLFIALPPELDDLRLSRDFLEAAVAGWEDWRRGSQGYDIVHAFSASRSMLERHAEGLLGAIKRDGMIWISWPKKASGVPTDVTEDVIRELVLPMGLVDIKVAAVNEIWSALKLCIRKELR